eukprot:1831707-Amphidinium_carterae.1
MQDEKQTYSPPKKYYGTAFMWYEALVTNQEDPASCVDYHDKNEDPRVGRWWKLMLKWLSYQDLDTVLEQYAEAMHSIRENNSDNQYH